MKTTLSRLLALSAGLLAFAVSGLAQTTPPTTTPPTTPPGRPTTPPGIINRTEVQARIAGFQEARDKALAERKALIEQLQGKTETERAAILSQLREQHAAQRELARQIRDQLRAVREERRKGGG
jgi:hypothetical protein